MTVKPDPVAPGPVRLDTGAGRFRFAPIRAAERVAILGPLPGAPAPRVEGVVAAVAAVRSHGFDRAVSPALAPIEQPAFVAAGFRHREHLHLLQRRVRLADARREPPTPPLRLARCRPADRAEVLDLDHRSFDGFWQLDALGLADAVAATPAARFRVARLHDELVGYAITGRAGRRGYLQRLAVDAGFRRRGIAGALVADGLRWLARHGVRSLAVNTQESNRTALSCYRALGFELEPRGLDVLEIDLTGPAPAARG